VLDELRRQVLAANHALVVHGLVTLTWGNASGFDRDSGLMAIKPSGVPYGELTSEDIVLVDLDGAVAEGHHQPSIDTPTHLALYQTFPELGGVVHSHSTWATAWAQAQRPIPVLGTTHADLSAHPIPLTRPLTELEVADGYEAATGRVLVEAVSGPGPIDVPCALVRSHAPFCWGEDASSAVENAVTLEEVARMALLTRLLDPDAAPLADPIRTKHFERKHGPSAYYGQRPRADTT
jgi:L-ribulose-5-phosphate 4-epimerase